MKLTIQKLFDFMRAFLHELSVAASRNLTVSEGVILLLLAGAAWKLRNRNRSIPAAYSIFLILYITLLRRETGYDENIRLYIRLFPSAGVFVGNFLNFLLYIPFGWTAEWGQKKQNRETFWGKTAVCGLLLSVFCETMQYLTRRGWVDVNDVLCNLSGTVVGVWLAKGLP